MATLTVYVVTNTLNGMQYVGATSQAVPKRWKYHLWAAGRGHNLGCTALWEAIRTFGACAFIVDQVACAETRSDIHEIERLIIAQYKTLAPYGYNIQPGGTGLGSKLSVVTRERMAASHTGKKITDESRKKMSIVQTEIHNRPDAIARMRAQVQSDETRQKRVATLTGRSFSNDHLINIKKAHNTPEYKAKMVPVRKSRWDRPGAREKQAQVMREVQKLRW